MKNHVKRFMISAALFTAFLLWTAMLCLIDVRPIGPLGSLVGLAALNGFVRDLIGVHFDLYIITDWLSLVPIFLCMSFGILGLCQWIKRKHLGKVDHDILILGGFYLLVFAAYLLFEQVVINYRPVLIKGILEVSYPSSTTMLALSVMVTAMIQCKHRIKNEKIRNIVLLACAAFTAFMVISRLLSGVHWFTDIIGGTLLSMSMISLYDSFVAFVENPLKQSKSTEELPCIFNENDV